MSANTTLKKIAVHLAGNKNNGEALYLSPAELQLSDDLKEILSRSFLDRFKNNHEYFSFAHPSSLQYNEVYNYCTHLFADADSFLEKAQAVATHLYNASTHPKIKGGEVYVCLFDGLPVESKVCQAISIFKTETKSLFLEAAQNHAGMDIQLREGVELSRLDKGCLIINQKKDEGYDVLLFDNQNRGEEAHYWKDTFLSVQPQKNEYHNTQHLLQLTKQFITGPLQNEHGVEKDGQAELLHKSIDYFRSKDSFDIDEFQSEVFGDEEQIEAFRQFGGRYVQSNDFDLAAQFDISAEAVKKQSRIFKSVVKLDKNFHIYIHGRSDLIEKGTDENGRKYYKLFYQEEG